MICLLALPTPSESLDLSGLNTLFPLLNLLALVMPCRVCSRSPVVACRCLEKIGSQPLRNLGAASFARLVPTINFPRLEREMES